MNASPTIRRLGVLLLAPFFVLACGPSDSSDAPIQIQTDSASNPELTTEGVSHWSPITACEPVECQGFCGVGDDGCGTTVDCGECGEPGHLRVSDPELDLVRGQKRVIDVWIADDQGHIFLDPELAWSARDAAIASVDEIGSVFGMTPGTTIVYVEYQGLEGASLVTVIENPRETHHRIARGCADPDDTNC